MNTPQNIDANELLYNAQAIFNEKRIDSIVVTDGDVAIGMLDIQDLQKLK